MTFIRLTNNNEFRDVAFCQIKDMSYPVQTWYSKKGIEWKALHEKITIIFADGHTELVDKIEWLMG